MRCINNPRDKHLSQAACIISLLGSSRSCGTSLGNSLLCTGGLVCLNATLALAWSCGVWPKGPPFCVPSALGQEPRRSGLRFKSNKLLQHFRDGIWRYQHAKPGRGWPIALPTRPWELLLPRLRRGDLCQCRALKYHGSAFLPSSCLHFTHPQTDSMTQTHFITYYPFIFILCVLNAVKGAFLKPQWVTLVTLKSKLH